MSISKFEFEAFGEQSSLEVFNEVPDFSKNQLEWRDELIKVGFIEARKLFHIKNQLSPIRVTLADNRFINRCGSNPRITYFKKAENDSIFEETVKALSLDKRTSNGNTFIDYDFYNVRTVNELGEFIFKFETKYRAIKAAKSQLASATVNETKNIKVTPNVVEGNQDLFNKNLLKDRAKLTINKGYSDFCEFTEGGRFNFSELIRKQELAKKMYLND
ncbi:hypothetical protein RI845_13545 [Thalassotalea nanhaiensis]|uniref:Uncharacterized protein n=1 Tax=Thalassotalea nanhaiensis TaxID=3065648 RepID=A0ABY9TFK2_9GAMM|nr:hypothetical protein RI845_13545 [Colwelliaceae bacterium SQ345]